MLSIKGHGLYPPRTQLCVRNYHLAQNGELGRGVDNEQSLPDTRSSHSIVIRNWQLLISFFYLEMI